LGIFLLAQGFAIVEAQTHETALMTPFSIDSVKSDTVQTIAKLTLDNLRLVVGLEEMQAHIARMVKMGQKAGFMWMDLSDTHIISIGVFQQHPDGRSRLITDEKAKISFRVIKPNGQESETREMYFITGLDSFNEGFNLAAEGKYHFTILLERKGKSSRPVNGLLGAEFTYEVK
jgi:hypothetical protein